MLSYVPLVFLWVEALSPKAALEDRFTYSVNPFISQLLSDVPLVFHRMEALSPKVALDDHFTCIQFNLLLFRC